MKVEVYAEYACGHPLRVVASGEVRSEAVTEDIAGIVSAATAGGEVVLNCRSCGRGAAYLNTSVDGRLASRIPAAAFVGSPGARLTVRPREEGE